MIRRTAARAVAAPAAAAILGMLALGTALSVGAALAVTPEESPVFWVGFAPRSTEPVGGHQRLVARAVEIARRLDRNREPDGRPAWLTIVGYAPGDAVLAARRAVAVRGALLRAGVAPERVTLLEPNLGPAPPALPDGGEVAVEVALCPAASRLARWRCAPP